MPTVSVPSVLSSLSGLIGPRQRRNPPHGTAHAVPTPRAEPGAALPVTRVLECMAGFYQHEADGRDAMRHLRLSLGLSGRRSVADDRRAGARLCDGPTESSRMTYTNRDR